MTPQPSHSAFFYGTLMAPAILHRVCHGTSDPHSPAITHSIASQPAILPSHRRHRVAGADYPAILPHTTSTVRGTYVTGLTDRDIWRLDEFEGDEYERRKVRCRLGSGEEVECETYVWVAGEGQLEDREWDFEEFRREKMRNWVGVGGEAEYAAVDEAVAAAENGNDGTRGRGVNGHISKALEEENRTNMS